MKIKRPATSDRRGRSLGYRATRGRHRQRAHARPAGYRLATVVAAVRARRSLDEIDGWLPARAVAHLRSGDEMATRYARYPGAAEHAARLGRELAFDLRLVAPRLPACNVGQGHTEMSWLRHLTMQGPLRRYGTREQNPDAYGAWGGRERLPAGL